MCFGELCSMFPKSGGIYEFCKQAYGRFFSFLIGWMTIIAGNITIAMLVVGAIQYLLPVGSPFLKVMVSLIFIFVFNYIAFKGMQTSAVMLVVFAFITLVTLFALIIPGLFKLQLGNFKPFFVTPFPSLIVTIFLIAETFFGWETATFLAEETKDGKRVMPKALIWGTVIIAIISLLFVVSSLGVIPWEVFGKSTTPLSDLGILHYGILGSDIFTILVYLAIIGSVAGWIVSAPRLLLAMAKDKLFLTQFAAIHKKNNTPHMAIIFQTVLTTILVIVGSGSYTTMLHLLVPIVLVAYSFVLVSLVILRYKQPNTKRYFTVPFGKVGPIIVAAFMLFLIVMWLLNIPGSFNIILLILSMILLGIPIYFLIEMYHNANAIRMVNEKLTFLRVLMEKVLFPRAVRRRIFALVGNMHKKKVLEYGCSTGILTKHIAERVSPQGKVYAFDTFEHNVNITKKKMEKHKQVSVHHHKSLTHFKTKVRIPEIDIIISAGALSNLQKPAAVIKHLGKKVKKGGRIVFVDYDKFFYIIPNTPWLSDDKKLLEMFEQAGFTVQIIKKRGLLWRYIFIHGKKRR